MDGSGISSPYESIQESNSLHDVYAGYDKKTILQSNSADTGTPSTLKWAVYANTNERRRLSKGSDVSLERIHRLMHNRVFDEATKTKVNQGIQKYFNNNFRNGFYIFDENSQQYYLINAVRINGNSENGQAWFRQRIACDVNGNPPVGAVAEWIDIKGNVVNPDTLTAEEIEANKIKCIYDIDQFFGGA